jgi:gluconokinase
MPPSLLDSQLATLEPPGDDENVVRVDLRESPQAIVQALLSDPRLQPFAAPGSWRPS